MTRVLLVQPAVNFERTYPLGLAYIAGILRRHGVEVSGIDLRLAQAGALEAKLGASSYDLVGVTAYSSAPEAAARVAQAVRRHQPDARTVLGGPHAAFFGKGAAPGGDSLWDHVVRGDGELPMLALARGEELPGERGGLYLHPDLADLDFPDREVFPLERYYSDGLHTGRWTAMVASRGCSRRCGHCAAFHLSGGVHRRRDPAAVVEELRRLNHDHGVDGVMLEDDTLFADRAWALELLTAMADANTGVRLHLPNGTDPMLLDDELLAAAARAGVTSLALGIESLDPAKQAALGRIIEPGHLRQVIRTARQLGMRVAGYFIIGLPGDTVPGVLAQYPRMRRLGLDLAHVSVYQDLPGLPLPAPSTTPARRAALAALKGLFYPYYYADAARIRRALGKAEPSPALLIRAAARFSHWVLR